MSLIKGAADDLVHVVIAIFAEAAAEDDVGALRGFGLVFGEKFRGGLGVDGIVGDVTGFPVRGELAADDSLGTFEDGLALGMEVLELVDACVRNVGIGIVHDRGALPVLDLLGFPLEAEAAPG